MPPPCDIAETLAFPRLHRPGGSPSFGAWPWLAPTVNPGDDDADEDGNIEPDDDESIGDDDEDDDDEDPLWASHVAVHQFRIVADNRHTAP